MSNENHTGVGEQYGVPNPQPNRSFTVHDKAELYQDATNPGRGIVANPRDLIVDYDNNSFWRVKATDYTNYTYELEPFHPVPKYNVEIEIGGCAPHLSDTFRVYVDDTKHPASLRIDGRLTVSGTDLDSVRIFRGKRIDSGGEVISGNYSSGQIVSDRIPLALAAVQGNKTIKSAMPGVCTRAIDDGELITLVYYSENSEVAAIAYCYVVKTSMVMAMEAPVKQVLDVKLKSPFMSKSDDTLLELPINIPLDDIPLQAEIKYTDTSRLVTIDGTRANLDGLRNSGSHDTFYISSNVGQTLPLVLSYRLGKNETYVGGDVVDGVINKHYKASTLEIDGSYSVKLFVVPRWLDVDRGYRLDYYLYDLERGNVFYATPFVTSGEGSEVFDPKLYNYKQRLIVRVDLSQVSQTYNAHIHPQSFHISLQAPGNENRTNFLLDYIHDGNTYGEDVGALFHYSNTNFWKMNVSCSAKSKAEWLQRLYYNSYPLFDRRSESAAPEPTHFEVHIGDEVYTLPVDGWMDDFNIDFQVDEGQLIMIRWIRRTPQDELHLALSPMIAHQK